MHTLDVIVLCAAVLAIVVCASVLARQRYMLRVQGGVPMAMQGSGGRWLYGIARYVGGELRWYRALGVGTRPSVVLRRADTVVVGRRAPLESERGSVAAHSVVVMLRTGGRAATLALGEGAYTGLQSWLEASAPLI